MKVLVAGDFVPQARCVFQIQESRFAEVFNDDFCALVRSADFSFVNFESPVVERGCEPIVKCGPNLSCTASAVEAVKYAGFTGVTLANNHILDYGVDGLRQTVQCCKNAGLAVAGIGENLEDAGKPLYLEDGEKILAVINCCEHEFSIATDARAGANPLDPIRQFYAIREAKRKADHVLVIVHGGHECYQLPSLRMVQTYRFFIDAGADAVVNHHQHCFSGYEIYNGKPIVYGLGNLCFDYLPYKVGSSWNYGYMVSISFDESIKFEISPYRQYAEKPTIELLDKEAIADHLNELCKIISDSEMLKKEVDSYYELCAKSELGMLEPYGGRVMSKLLDLNMLPRFVKGKKAAIVLNHIDCESHRDKLLFALKGKLNN